MIDVLFCDLFLLQNHNYPIWRWTQYFFLVMSSINATMRYTKLDFCNIFFDFGVRFKVLLFVTYSIIQNIISSEI